MYDGNPQDLPFQQISCYSNTVLNILNSKRVRPCVWSNFRRLAQLLLCPGDVFDAKSDTFGSNLENLLWISCGCGSCGNKFSVLLEATSTENTGRMDLLSST